MSDLREIKRRAYVRYNVVHREVDGLPEVARDAYELAKALDEAEGRIASLLNCQRTLNDIRRALGVPR